MKILLLAGGSGTRLWPISTKKKPKQFCSFFENSLFKQAILRSLQLVSAENIIVITSIDYEQWVKRDLPKGAKVIYEYEKKNTLGAVCQGIRDLDDKEVVLVLTSDHYIKNQKAFFAGCRRAEKQAKNGQLCIFGKKPLKPHIGYGYIQTGNKKGMDFFVTQFIEKPSLKKAEHFFMEKNYYWNLGMFCFLKSTFVHKLRVYQKSWYDFTVKKTSRLGQGISVDYGILEKSKGVFMVALDEVEWLDVGAFDALFNLSEKDENRNVLSNATLSGCKGNYIHMENLQLSMIDIEDLIVVQKGDKLLICPLQSAQKIKNQQSAREGEENDYVHA